MHRRRLRTSLLKSLSLDPTRYYHQHNQRHCKTPRNIMLAQPLLATCHFEHKKYTATSLSAMDFIYLMYKKQSQHNNVDLLSIVKIMLSYNACVAVLLLWTKQLCVTTFDMTVAVNNNAITTTANDFFLHVYHNNVGETDGRGHCTFLCQYRRRLAKAAIQIS